MKYGSSEQIGRLPLTTPKIATSCFIRIFFIVRWTSRCLATSFCERYIDQVDYSENRQVAFSLYCALLQHSLQHSIVKPKERTMTFQLNQFNRLALRRRVY